jgi:hypothetical protein
MARFRTTPQIRKALHSRRLKNKTWREKAEACNIFKANGDPDPGMAWRLANEPAYEPRDLTTRIRLGMSPICPTCHRRLPHTHPTLRRWIDLPDDELAAALANRRPITPAWVQQAADHLATLERRAYARRGKPV